MNFNEFQRLNAKRCREAFDESLHDVPFFTIAITGEAGEMANIVKKVLRGDLTLQSARFDILNELADIITYCDLMITKLEANTQQTLMSKFNIVSERRKWEDK